MCVVGLYILPIVHYRLYVMAKTDIIGHRGAAGLALENTKSSFKKAVEVGAHTFEFDVRMTRDGQFVVCHDDTLGRVSNSTASIKSITYDELKRIPLWNNEHVPLLSDVLEIARAYSIRVIVEIKIEIQTDAHLENLCQILDEYEDLTITVASFKHATIATMQKIRPDYRFYLAENRHPITAIRKARATKVQGIDLNYKLLNPLTYCLARYWKLEIMIFTVNSLLLGRIIRLLYPAVAMCTNYPDRFIAQTARQEES